MKLISGNFSGIKPLFMLLALLNLAPIVHAKELPWPEKTYFRYREVEGDRIFYREAGDATKPTIVLLHGFPSSSHTYRELIPLLSGRFHVIAPDNLGSGYSDHPDPERTTYSFDLLSRRVSGLLSQLRIEKYVLYMQDFGAPVGYRMMLNSPESLQALIVQNANAYLAGLTDARLEFFKSANQERSARMVASLLDFVGREAIIHRQYLRDVQGKEDTMSPDSWTHDLAFLQTDKDRMIQVQLFQDYYNNLVAYPTWQAFLHKRRPPTLIVWGQRDPAFLAEGARAYLQDIPDAELHLIDAGHFAVEEKAGEIANHILDFLDRVFSQAQAAHRD